MISKNVRSITYDARLFQNRAFDQSNFILAIIVIDLLFMPRILPLFGIPASLFFVCFYIVTTEHSKKLLFYLYLIFFVGFISSCLGIALKGHYFIDDSKRIIQLSSALLYTFVLLRPKHINIRLLRLILVLFFMWLALLALVFALKQELYIQIIQLIYPETIDTIDENLNAFRFSYFFSDPNSAGYFLCFATYLYMMIQSRQKYRFFIYLAVLPLIILTQSRGAYIAYMVIFVSIISDDTIDRYKKYLTLFALTSVCVALWIFFSELIYSVFDLFEARANAEEALGEGLGGGRIGKYVYFFTNLNPLPFGTGYFLLKDGLEFRPHSDLIRINFAYGLPFLLLLAVFVLPKSKHLLPLFVLFLIPFLINTIIDDYKLLPFYLVAMNIITSAKFMQIQNRFNAT